MRMLRGAFQEFVHFSDEDLVATDYLSQARQGRSMRLDQGENEIGEISKSQFTYSFGHQKEIDFIFSDCSKSLQIVSKSGEI